MGLFRLLLALSVALAHANLRYGLPAAVAVQSFFLMSGFYMALVLDRRYREAWRFYANRALRLLPAYWVVALLTLLLATGPDPSLLPATARWFLAAANTAVVGQDAVMFLGASADRGLYFAADFRQTDPQLWHYLLVPQAWSLGVEILFYLCAPVLVRCRTRVLVGLLAAALTARCLTYAAGFGADPWTYRFFPFELALFVAGICSFRAHRRWAGAVAARLSRLGGAATAGLIGLLVAYRWLPDATVGPVSAKSVAFFACLAAALPVAFLWSTSSRADRLLGDLSYPVFIGHWLVMILLTQAGLRPSDGHGLLFVAAVLSASTVLWLVVDRPVDRWRHSVRWAAGPRGSAAPARMA
jgi:peptidoglycan/LPS O-acetylase OafA/YrhL